MTLVIPPDDQLRSGWTELYNSGTVESIDDSSNRIEATRIFRGPWSDRLAFLADYLPQSVSNGNPNYSYTTTLYPGIPVLIAYKADITGHLTAGTDEEGFIEYDKAQVTIFYKADSTTFFLTSSSNGGPPATPTGNGQPIVKTTYVTETNVELIKFQGKNVKDKDGKRKHANGDYEYPLRLTTLKITYHDISFSWADTDNHSTGKIFNKRIIFNDNLFILDNDPYTLRFDGVSATLDMSLRNIASKTLQSSWNVTYNLTYNPLRWNRKPIGCEPQVVGQPNAMPVNLIFEDICLYEDITALFGLQRVSYV